MRKLVRFLGVGNLILAAMYALGGLIGMPDIPKSPWYMALTNLIAALWLFEISGYWRA